MLKLLSCRNCDGELGWVDFFKEYTTPYNSMVFYCLVCHELRQLKIQQAKLDSKKPLKIPENTEKLKEIQRRKIDLIESCIQELEEQKIKVSERL